jgi:hypothetical protein
MQPDQQFRPHRSLLRRGNLIHRLQRGRPRSFNDFFALDALGSVMGLFSANGTWSSYSPYGETRAASSAYSVAINPIRYISVRYLR